MNFATFCAMRAVSLILTGNHSFKDNKENPRAIYLRHPSDFIYCSEVLEITVSNSILLTNSSSNSQMTKS